MAHTYTHSVQKKFDAVRADELDDNTALLKALVNEFDRPFCDGLAELLKYSSYKGDIRDAKAKTEFICRKLEAAGIPVSAGRRKNLKNWVKGTAGPGPAAREQIYELCFALSLSLDQVHWFFDHVFFQRSFNCHRQDEAVYYYCFTHGHSYRHARRLLAEIRSCPESEAPDPEAVFYTEDIRLQLDQYDSDEELKQYFKDNARAFRGGRMNRRAKENILRLLADIRGKEADKAVIRKVMHEELNPEYASQEIRSCGLVVQEILAVHDPGSYIKDTVHCRDISSLSFMLERIYGSAIHTKAVDLPVKRRKNFPGEKVFSDLLGGFDLSANYDAIRKCLILLKFYHFWCSYELHPASGPVTADPSALYDIYAAETNDLLTECGCPILFAGNNYDRLFMLCAKSHYPLGDFRSFFQP